MTDIIYHPRPDDSDDVADMPRHIRNCVALCGDVNIELSAHDALRLARLIEAASQPQLVLVAPPRLPIWQRDPVRMAGLILCLCAMVLA